MSELSRYALVVILMSSLSVLLYINYNANHSFLPFIQREHLFPEPNGSTRDVLAKYSGLRHDKWIVVTTINAPTKQVHQLARIPGWKMVVIGDTKTPAGWSLPGVVYLSIQDQQQLPYTLAKLLPTKRYTRKSLGYLFAIQHGAEVIYETDDDNVPTDEIKNFFLVPGNISGLVINATEISYNPCKHFGQSTLWPRGYPLERIGTSDPRSYRLYSSMKTPPIQQGFVNGDPDLDALYRLTRKHVSKPLDIKFDSAAPPVILPEGSFAPMNSQNTLFHKSAFWALLLPTTVTDRVTDIYRSYWSQKLLWMVGEKVAFFPPNAYQARSPHSYISDAKLEKEMYHNTGKLLAFLKSWTCKLSTFSDCVISLSAEMSQNNFWLDLDTKLVAAWIYDLTRLGYTFPSLTRQTKEEEFRSVVYYPNEQLSSWMYSPEYILPRSLTNHKNIGDHIQKHCKVPKKVNYAKIVGKKNKTSDIILVVGVSNVRNVINFDIVHKMHFPNIIYCGKTLPASFFHQWNVTYVDVLSKPSAMRCLMNVVEMRHVTRGYVYVRDNAFINFNAFLDKDFGDSPWISRNSSTLKNFNKPSNATEKQCVKELSSRSKGTPSTDSSFYFPAHFTNILLPILQSRMSRNNLQRHDVDILSFFSCYHISVNFLVEYDMKNLTGVFPSKYQLYYGVNYASLSSTNLGDFICSFIEKADYLT